MVRVEKLKNEIRKRNTNLEKLAEAIDIDTSTLYRKMRRNGETFSIGEAERIKQHLKLSKKEAMNIFFDN